MNKFLLDCFSDISDPRVERTRLHKFEDIIAIVICAAICGADGWNDIALFAGSKHSWLKSFLELPNGIPSHDTISRVVSTIKPDDFEQQFQKWTQSIAQGAGSGVIAIDGKTIRRSFDSSDSKAAVHMVSAWACDNQLVFGQIAVDQKSNEITAIPKLLEMLVLDGSVVTIDAMGCQKKIAGKIKECKADYLLSLKGNHGTLHEEVKLFMDDAIANSGPLDYDEVTNGGHGRIETRKVWYCEDVNWIKDRREWPGLSSLVAVESRRQIGDKISYERRYFISSLSGKDAKAVGQMIRSHWQIENSLHWTLDVTFGEDDCRIRNENGAENYSRVRRLALNLLKQEKSAKCSIRAKQLKAGWDEKYLVKVLEI